MAQTDLLTCCAHSAALQNNSATSILPVTVGASPMPVATVWRKNSAEAQRAVDQLARALAPLRDPTMGYELQGRVHTMLTGVTSVMRTCIYNVYTLNVHAYWRPL